MAVFDVRDSEPNILEIVFADVCVGVAYSLDISNNLGNGCVSIRDDDDYLVIESAEHARNLQKALDKAIELGWLK